MAFALSNWVPKNGRPIAYVGVDCLPYQSHFFLSLNVEHNVSCLPEQSTSCLGEKWL